VIPVALRGTRACLPADRLLPSPGRIEVEVLTALQRDRPRCLRDGARAALLAALGASRSMPWQNHWRAHIACCAWTSSMSATSPTR
jgi:hypothetical protein